MKFQPDALTGVNTITRQEPGRLWIADARFEGSLLVPWRGAVQSWSPADFDALSASDFDAVAALRPEVVILGTGDRGRFPAPALLRALIEARIGVESMATAAAVRTYNVLVIEGRAVVGAFIGGRSAAPSPG